MDLKKRYFKDEDLHSWGNGKRSGRVNIEILYKILKEKGMNAKYSV